jgi:hypothetical protein
MPSPQIIIASTRPGRVRPPVAQWFHARAVAHGGFDAPVQHALDVEAALRPVRRTGAPVA